MNASAATLSKGLSQQSPVSSQPQAHTGSASGDASLTRRPGGAAGRTASAPRNNQSLRKQHKTQRRPKMADEDISAVSTAISATSSRKGRTSITHLMNFTLPPRPTTYTSYHQRYGTRRQQSWGFGSGHHAQDKARYIHANYRFIVDPSGDYSLQAGDPDVPLEWDSIMQVLASASSQSTGCPICLSVPVAPRMARCGHIFCLPCLIRYMHSTDGATSVPEKKSRWKKCPICWDSVYLTDVKPLRWFSGQEGMAPQEGHDIVLRLMKRKPGSTLALPRDCAEMHALQGDVPWFEAADVADHARIMKGSESYMEAEFEREKEEILIQENEDELLFGEETLWTEKATKAVNFAKDKLAASSSGGGHDTSPPKVAANGVSPLPLHMGRRHNNRSRPQATFAAGNISNHDADDPDAGSFFFYQALPHYYLSPLDIRILKAAFGDFSSFPAMILPRVEHASTGHFIDDEIRRRTKYLGHLPYGCEFGFLECDWNGVVPAEVLDQFSKEIEARRKKNKDKQLHEDRERQRAEKVGDERRWMSSRRGQNSEALDGYNTTGSEGFSVPSEIFSQLDLGETSSSSSPPFSVPRAQGSSFAPLASQSTSPSGPKTVWGTTAITSSEDPPAEEQDVPIVQHDGWLQGWEQDLLQEEGLLYAEAYDLAPTGNLAASSSKKKKAKKITLMSTNARRAA